MNGAYQNNFTALKILNKIAPHWNTVVIKSSMNTKSDILRNIRNDINTNIDKGLDIFLGHYDDINTINVGNSCTPVQKAAAKKSLLLYPDKFAKLSSDEQDKLLTFLAKYRSTFNILCMDAANTVFNSIENSERNYNYDLLNKEINNAFKQSPLVENINGSLVSLFNSYNRSIKNNRDMLMTDKITWCCSFYLPLVKKLSENIKKQPSGETVYKQLYNKNHLMRIFPIVNTEQEPVEPQQTVLGGSQQQQQQPTTIVKTKYVYVGGGSNDKQTKSSTGEYIEELVNAQVNFNKSFEQIYRDLTKSLYTITISNKQSTQSTSLNGCLYALKAIEINSPKTSYKISGYYSAKNWNKYFVNACRKAVYVLEKDGMNLFDETIKCIKDLINLCEQAAKQADEIISKYITSVKISSETFGNVKNVSKIACKLSHQELNRYGENIKRLEQAFSNISNQTSIYSTSQLLDSFLSHVQDRNDLIREYFRNKETQLKLNGSQGFNSDRVEMLLQFNNQVKQCMLYLNQTVDTKLAEYRKQKNNTQSDDKLFAKFEKAMVMFKDLSNNANLRTILEKLHIVLTGTDFEHNEQHDKQKKYGLDLIRILQRFWKESGYVDFIIQLYNELNIFPDGFNWSEFRDNITLLLSIINITVATTYKVNVSATNAHTNQPIDKIVQPLQTLEINIKDALSIQDSITKIVDEIKTCYDLNENTTNILQPVVFNTIQQMFNFASSSDKLVGKTQQLSVRINGAQVPAVFDITLFDKRFAMTLTTKKENDNGELRLTKMIFDAMLVNILDVINSYTTIKYTGNFKLPIQLSNIIKGGNKGMLAIEDSLGNTYGGNVFDILSVNDNNYDGVVVDATPFYVCAFNIVIFYYSKYNVGKIGDDVSTPTLFFYVPKISPLYPIYKKIEAYNIDTTSKLNANLIKTGVGVFNNYWRKSEGATPGEKLSNAIDILLNEVNACMVYSSKLQFDSLQITGKLTNNFLQNLSSNIQNLSQSLVNAINEAVVNMSMDSLQQTELFETIMKNDLNKVRNKSQSEEEKLGALIDILTKSNEKQDASNEIYKFLDFGVMPMLETLVAYNNVFKVYDLYLVDKTQVNAQKVDLNQIKFIVRSINPAINGQEMTYPEWLQAIVDTPTSDVDMTILREQLETSGVVNAWNTIMLANYIDECMRTKNYRQPILWYPNIYSTWPKNNLVAERVNSVSTSQTNTSDIMLTLYQLYPYINGKTIWDYFEATLSEFTSDIDHCLHLLMSYPNINDKFIKAINNEVHKIVDDDQTITARLGISDEIKTRLMGIKMNHELGYVKPPAYKSNYFVPQYTHDKSILQQMVVYNSGEYIPTYVSEQQKFIPLDGYNQSVLIQKFSNIGDNVAEYSWTDWVIQKLAECDTTFECVPYKFVEALRSQTAISYRCQPLIFDNATTASIQPLAQTPRGKYVNPITGNIIARSISDRNMNKTDDNGKIAPQWITNLIGVIPYMINKLKAYYNNVSATVEYENINIKTELNILLTILSTFYNDIVSYCPKVGFMENLTLFDNNRQYHAIAEMLPHLQKYNFENSTSSQFSKYIWANRYFFGTNADILFPESKDYDRFAKIKEFGGNVFNNGVFDNEFNTVMTILGKCLIMSSIATSQKDNIANNNVSAHMFKTIARAIYYSSELIPAVHTRFVNNVINALSNDNSLISSYSRTNQQSERPDANLQTNNVSESLSSVINTIRQSGNNYVIGRLGDSATENLVLNKIFTNTFTQDDYTKYENVVHNLHRMLVFQQSAENSVALPNEASIDYMDKIMQLPREFWTIANQAVATSRAAAGNLTLSNLVSPPRGHNSARNSWKASTPQTIYVLAIATIIYWLNNGKKLATNNNAVIDRVLNELNDISDSVVSLSANNTAPDKNKTYLHNLSINPHGNIATVLAQTTSAIFNQPHIFVRHFYARLLSALVIFKSTTQNTLRAFIRDFNIGNETSAALTELYNGFKAIHPLDVFFNMDTIDFQDAVFRRVFKANIADGANNVRDAGLIFDRNGLERHVKCVVNGNNVIVANNLLGKYIQIDDCPPFDDAADATITKLGIRYTTGAGDNDMDVAPANRIGNVVAYTAPFNSYVVDKQFITDVLQRQSHEMYNMLPIHVVPGNAFQISQQFVGGASPNKLYGLLFSGIADVNRMNALPFNIYDNTNIDEAIKNVCYTLNTIPEYKVCGVINSNTYVPHATMWFDDDRIKTELNIVSYIKNRQYDNMTTTINNAVYSSVYVFPPAHTTPTEEFYNITTNDIASIRQAAVRDLPTYVHLRNAINNISNNLTIEDNANRKVVKLVNETHDNYLIVVKYLLDLFSHLSINSQNNVRKFINHDNVLGPSDYVIDVNSAGTYYFSDSLYQLFTADEYTENKLLTPINFADYFMFYIIQMNDKVFVSSEKIKIALYATLLCQSVRDNVIETIIDSYERSNDIVSVFNKMLSIVYTKSVISDNYSIFKDEVPLPDDYIVGEQQQLVDARKGEFEDIIRPSDYDKFANYQVNRSSLLITAIEQPTMMFYNNNIQYSNIDSMTTIYNLINPTAGLLNASSTIISGFGDEMLALIGCTRAFVIDKEQHISNNIIEHAMGTFRLFGSGQHSINTNTRYSELIAVNGKQPIDIGGDVAAFINAHQGMKITYSTKTTEALDRTAGNLFTLLNFVNRFASSKMFKTMLLEIFAIVQGQGGDFNAFIASPATNEYRPFLQHQLLNTLPPIASINNIDPDDDTFANKIGVNERLFTKFRDFVDQSKPTQYFTMNANKLENDTTSIRLFDTCKTILEKIKHVLTTTLSTTFNTGFAHGLFSGGATEFEFNSSINELVSSFVDNTDYIGSYYSPSETYRAIYKLQTDTGVDKLAKNVYSNLFKYTPIETLKTEFMFALIINYFHKYTVSFNSIYNSVIFPSIIYGSAVFNTIAHKYKDTFDHANIDRNNAFTAFVHKYLTTIDGETFERYYSTDDQRVNRNTKSQTYRQLADTVVGHPAMYQVSSMVSVNDKLLNLLNKHDFIGEHANDDFLNSSLLGTIKRIDAVETFTFIILLIVKYMSYYNLDTDEDVPYSGQIGPNPLGYNISV